MVPPRLEHAALWKSKQSSSVTRDMRLGVMRLGVGHREIIAAMPESRIALPHLDISAR
jgi:hypothetical protein